MGGLSVAQKEVTTVTCPKCGNHRQAEIYKSVNAEENKDIKEKILDRSAFMFVCDKCGYTASLAYPCLYHDAQKGIFIQLAPDYSSADVEMIRQTVGGVDFSDIGDYKMRLVGTVEELIEKIKIFDSGKDDMVIELCKLFISKSVTEQKPDFMISRVYFDSHDQDVFVLFDDKCEKLVIPVNKEFYDESVQVFGDKIEDEIGDFKIIDRSWAIEAVRH